MTLPEGGTEGFSGLWQQLLYLICDRSECSVGCKLGGAAHHRAIRSQRHSDSKRSLVIQLGSLHQFRMSFHCLLQRQGQLAGVLKPWAWWKNYRELRCGWCQFFDLRSLGQR